MTDQPDMRQVVLAYPREINGKLHDPDSTVELPAQGFDGAKQLVREGRARWPEGTDQGRPMAAEQTTKRTRATSPGQNGE